MKKKWERFWHFLTPSHYTNLQNSMFLFDYSWFLAKNISNYVSLLWKLYNRYCHTAQLPIWQKLWLYILIFCQGSHDKVSQSNWIERKHLRFAAAKLAQPLDGSLISDAHSGHLPSCLFLEFYESFWRWVQVEFVLVGTVFSEVNKFLNISPCVLVVIFQDFTSRWYTVFQGWF